MLGYWGCSINGIYDFITIILQPYKPIIYFQFDFFFKYKLQIIFLRQKEVIALLCLNCECTLNFSKSSSALKYLNFNTEFRSIIQHVQGLGFCTFMFLSIHLGSFQMMKQSHPSPSNIEQFFRFELLLNYLWKVFYFHFETH